MDPHAAPTVATVLEPEERPRLDAAAAGCFAAVHATSVRDVIRTVRERPVQAILVSPRGVPRTAVDEVGTLIQSFPGVPTVAVVSRHDAASSERLLEFGASGVRRFVDLTDRRGWHELRALVADPASPVSARILAQLIPALGYPPAPCRLFFETLVRTAPDVTTVRALCRRLHLPPSTFVSRFLRAGLPSPKRYLAWTRLLHAAAYLELRGLSIADVAYRLEYSSPQSFGRHVRALLGLTAGAFRRRYSFERALDEYLERLIVPYRGAFTTFQPVQLTVVGVPGHVGGRTPGGRPAGAKRSGT